MTDTYTMGMIALAIMAVAIWGPTVYIHRKKRRGGEAIATWHLALAIVLELIAFASVVVALHMVGFGTGEYYLVAALVVGAAGAHVLSSITFIPRKTG